MKLVISTLFAGFALAAAIPAQAQFAKPEDAIRYRQSAFVLMGNHMGRINGQLKADKPDVAAIQRSAAIVEFASKLPYEAFVANTESGGTPPTRAKPEVFKDSAKVADLRDKMQAEVAKLATVAKSGDVAAIRAQFGETGKSC
ncbi:MAG: cytochrome C, partial [Chloracidobacterium sp. CP2_5A]